MEFRREPGNLVKYGLGLWAEHLLYHQVTSDLCTQTYTGYHMLPSNERMKTNLHRLLEIIWIEKKTKQGIYLPEHLIDNADNAGSSDQKRKSPDIYQPQI